MMRVFIQRQSPLLPSAPPESGMSTVGCTSTAENDGDKSKVNAAENTNNKSEGVPLQPVPNHDSFGHSQGSLGHANEISCPSPITATKETKQRGPYNCGLCGKPKEGHTCPFMKVKVDSSLSFNASMSVMDQGSQVARALPHNDGMSDPRKIPPMGPSGKRSK
jgi:hypothetical protein